MEASIYKKKYGFFHNNIESIEQFSQFKQQ